MTQTFYTKSSKICCYRMMQRLKAYIGSDGAKLPEPSLKATEKQETSKQPGLLGGSTW